MVINNPNAIFELPDVKELRTWVKFTLDGVEYSDFIQLDVTNSIGENNNSSYFTGMFQNIHGNKATRFNINDEVKIYATKDYDPPPISSANTIHIFTGVIEDINYDGKEQFETITISGRDYSVRLMDSTVEPEVYNNQDVATIVEDTISFSVFFIIIKNYNSL